MGFDAHRWSLAAGTPSFQAVFVPFITWREDIAGLDLLSKLGIDIAHFDQQSFLCARRFVISAKRTTLQSIKTVPHQDRKTSL
jgi:hypothetical protein